jgi:hypothetical protein
MSGMFLVRRRNFAAALILPLVSLVGCSTDEIRASPSVSTAGAATNDVFLHGTVKRNNKAVSGARLEVIVEDELKAQEAKVGDTVESFTAASAVSDEEGAFTLRLNADDLPSKYFGAGRRDFLNYGITVFADKTLATWYGTMYPEGQPAVWRSSDEAATADAVMRADFDLATEKVTTIDSFDQKETGGLAVMRFRNSQR